MYARRPGKVPIAQPLPKHPRPRQPPLRPRALRRPRRPRRRRPLPARQRKARRFSLARRRALTAARVRRLAVCWARGIVCARPHIVERTAQLLPSHPRPRQPPLRLRALRRPPRPTRRRRRRPLPARRPQGRPATLCATQRVRTAARAKAATYFFSAGKPRACALQNIAELHAAHKRDSVKSPGECLRPVSRSGQR